MSARRSPVIIDNTNVQAWEMKPYVRLVRNAGRPEGVFSVIDESRFSIELF